MFPNLKAAVEIENYSGTEFDVWEVLPTKGIYFIELSGKTSFVETGTVIYRIAEYGKQEDFEKGVSPQEVIKEILEKENLVVAGGLQAIDENFNTISPSCCCGLESWRDWFGVNPNFNGIWLGHSPEPWIEYIAEDDLMRLWSDEKKSEHIDFPYAYLQECLLGVEKDLNFFLNVLYDWATQIDKDLAEDLVKKVKIDFDI